MTAEELKHALMNYHQIYKWWEVNSNRIDSIIHEMEGVKGIRYDKELSRGTNTNVDERMISLIAKKDELLVSSKHYENMVNAVHDFVDWLDEPYQELVRDKYFNEMCDIKLEEKYNYSRMSIWKILDKLVRLYTKL